MVIKQRRTLEEIASDLEIQAKDHRALAGTLNRAVEIPSGWRPVWRERWLRSARDLEEAAVVIRGLPEVAELERVLRASAGN